MTESEKINKALSGLCTGADKKSDTMILMTPQSNWDQFITPAPASIAILGELILISTGTDFGLEDKPPAGGFKHLRFPNSFRASLVQVSNAGWDAFNEAHTSMDQIRLYSANVETHIKFATKFLLQGSPEEVQKMLPKPLEKISQIADESLKLAKNIESRFLSVMQLTAELLEACTSTESIYQSRQKETERALNVAKLEEQAATAEKQEMENRLGKMQKEVQEAQENFKTAMDEMPSGATLLRMSLLENLVQGIKSITSIPNMMENISKNMLDSMLQANDLKVSGKKEKNVKQNFVAAFGEKLNESIDSRLAEQKVYRQVEPIHKELQKLAQVVLGDGNEAKPSPVFTAQSKEIISDIKYMLARYKQTIENGEQCENLSAKVMEICDTGNAICDQMVPMYEITAERKEDEIASICKNVISLRERSEKIAVVARKQTQSDPLDAKSPYLAKMPTQSTSGSIVQAQREEAHFKVNLAKETLKDAKMRQDKAYEEKKSANERLTKVLMEMEQLNLQKIDFDNIRDTLVKGITALADIREQWAKLIRFFSMLSNLIKCCFHASLRDFVDYAKTGQELSISGIPLERCFRDVIFEYATQSNKIAFVVNSIAQTYVQVSEEYLMDQITCLNKLIPLNKDKDKEKIQAKHEELHYGCRKAQDAIKQLVAAEKATFDEKVSGRMERIEKELAEFIPPLPPARESKMQEAIEAGFTPSFDNIDEMI